MRHIRGDTWLDEESLAYPEGSLCMSGRKAKVRCPDFKLRVVVVGVPDTFFSIPARCYAYGKTVSGYVTTEMPNDHVVRDDNDEYLYADDGEYVFIPYKYGKNADVFKLTRQQREAVEKARARRCTCDAGVKWHHVHKPYCALWTGTVVDA